MTDADPKLKEVFDRVREIPTLPAVLNQILDTINDPKSTARDLTAIIERDQAQCAQLLKLVNSSFYGIPRQIETVSRAVVVLGFNTVKQLALGVSVIETFADSGNEQFQIASFWEHSLLAATAGQLFSARLVTPLASSLFTLGLLHDIGKVIEAQFMSEGFAQVHDRIEEGTPALEAEKQVFGTDHAQIGQWVCDRWRFPQEISAAVGYHHQPPKADTQPEDMPDGIAQAIRAVYLSDQMAHAIESGGSLEPGDCLDQEVLGFFRARGDGLETWGEEAAAQYKEVVQLFR